MTGFGHPEILVSTDRADEHKDRKGPSGKGTEVFWEGALLQEDKDLISPAKVVIDGFWMSVVAD